MNALKSVNKMIVLTLLGSVFAAGGYAMEIPDQNTAGVDFGKHDYLLKGKNIDGSNSPIKTCLCGNADLDHRRQFSEDLGSQFLKMSNLSQENRPHKTLISFGSGQLGQEAHFLESDDLYQKLGDQELEIVLIDLQYAKMDSLERKSVAAFRETYPKIRLRIYSSVTDYVSDFSELDRERPSRYLLVGADLAGACMPIFQNGEDVQRVNELLSEIGAISSEACATYRPSMDQKRFYYSHSGEGINSFHLLRDTIMEVTRNDSTSLISVLLNANQTIIINPNLASDVIKLIPMTLWASE